MHCCAEPVVFWMNHSLPLGEWPPTFLCCVLLNEPKENHFFNWCKNGWIVFGRPSEWVILLPPPNSNFYLRFINIVYVNMNYLVGVDAVAVFFNKPYRAKREYFVVKKPHLVGVLCTSTKWEYNNNSHNNNKTISCLSFFTMHTRTHRAKEFSINSHTHTHIHIYRYTANANHRLTFINAIWIKRKVFE